MSHCYFNNSNLPDIKSQLNSIMNISDTCFICKRSSDQMLMLSCVHDPCISCAASTFAEQVHIKGQSGDIYICEICGQQTQLDSSTTSQLGNLAKSFVKMPSSIKVTTHSSYHHQPAKNRNFGSSMSPASKKKQVLLQNSKKITYFCKQHNEQEISYYCFTCQVNICPQCAIHGKHKEHDVKLMKKALGEVKGEYIQIMNKISGSQNSMTKYKDLFLRMIKETNQRCNRDKSIIGREFENIRNTLASKEKQLTKGIDDINKQNIQTLTKFLETINVHYEEIGKVKKSIQLILRKDEVLIFDEYKRVGDLQQKVKQIKKQSDQINGELVFLHTDYMQKQARNINDAIYKMKQVIKNEEVGSMQGESSRMKSSQLQQQT